MERRTPIERLRPAATRVIATNARLLEATPKRNQPQEAAQPREGPWSPLSSLPGGVAEGLDKYVDRYARPAANRGERFAKGLTKAHLRGLGPASDLIEYVGAEDKDRAKAGIVGGAIGSAIGGLVPGLEPVTVPLGSMAGNWAGHYVYDHREQIGDAVESELNTLRDQLGRELKHYAPYDLPDRLMRR